MLHLLHWVLSVNLCYKLSWVVSFHDNTRGCRDLGRHDLERDGGWINCTSFLQSFFFFFFARREAAPAVPPLIISKHSFACVSALIISPICFLLLSSFLLTQSAQVGLQFSSGPLHFIKSFYWEPKKKKSLIWRRKKSDAIKTSCAHPGHDALSLCMSCRAASLQPVSAQNLHFILKQLPASPRCFFFFFTASPSYFWSFFQCISFVSPLTLQAC